MLFLTGTHNSEMVKMHHFQVHLPTFNYVCHNMALRFKIFMQLEQYLFFIEVVIMKI